MIGDRATSHQGGEDTTPEAAPAQADRASADSPGSFAGASVKIDGVSKSYGNVRAVNNFSLDVSAGEFVALLGPSGSGKTTLFMTIAGFERAETGRVVVGGRDVTSAAPYDRGFGMVFQRYALFPHMSVGDNIGYPLKMRRIPSPERRKLVAEAIDMLDLGGLGSRRPDQISGGQQQRVALARALVFRPPVLLMDEPLAALDRKLREQVQLEIRRLHKDLGTTILYVTHDQEEAMVLADRVCVMRDGELLQLGTPAALYDEPEDAFVAGFLGRTNFLDAELVKVSGHVAEVTIAGDSHRVTVPASSSLAGRAAAGDKVSVAIRPEKVRVTAPGDGKTGRVTEVIFNGATTSVRVQLVTGALHATMVTDVESRRLQEGDLVGVSWPDEQSRVYHHLDDA